MKKLLTLAVLSFIFNMAQATTYYFSSVSGNDSYSSTQARSSSTPWKSIAKLNSIFNTLLPGDVVLFKRGETFYGSITITKSGTSTAPITIGAYGTGSNPVITGFQTITNWVSVGGGIWKATNSAFGSKMNVVTVNNKVTAMGRYPNLDQPNEGYLTVTSHVNNTSITSSQLTSTTSYTGGEVVIRKNFWTLDRCAITAHSGGTLTYTGGTSWYSPQDGFGFFIQNHIKTLDRLGEWSYSASTKTVNMYFGSSSPSSYTVKMSAIPSLVTASNDYYINITNLSFVGADNGILLLAGSNINVDGCDFTALVNAVSTYPNVTDKMKVTNSTFNNILDHGMLLRTTGSLIENNKMNNIGVFAGMGSSGDGGLKGITISGASNIIRYNSLDSVGFTAIRFEGGSNNVIQNNFISNFCFVKDDGAGIYTYKGTASTAIYTGQKIIGNIVLNAIGAPAGVRNPDYYQAAHGIYIDDNSSNVEISGNTAANCYGTGLFIHNARNLVLRNNTFYNNQNNQVIASYDRSSLASISGLTYRRNILVSKNPTQKVVVYQSILDNLSSFGSFDSNYYCRPLNNSMVVAGSEPSRKENHDVPVWYSRFKLDPNSKQSPITYPAYKTNKILSANKFANSAFNSSASGVSAWSSSSNVAATWNSSGKLDGGSLKISYSSVTTKASTIILALT
ncbi:MAG TPA: right-handed parallel beta-helix repeat-containing protein, partial [Flavitalea sp.]|nr:right-handed parallel beta-helix repeat-containing protein [Flavitalea sp.]